ncbi:MAG: PKD domain-containing protein [Tepidisphaeraceae bacterium]
MNDVAPKTFETLETRQLMSGVTLDDGVLTVAGLANQSNIATVRVENSTVHTVLNGEQQSFQLADVKTIRIEGGDAADTLAVDSSVKIPVRINGRGGDDSLVGGSGDDVIDGGAGVDTLVGQNGDDRFLRVESGDVTRGGLGRNAIIAAVTEVGNLPASQVGSSTSSNSTAVKVTSLTLINTDTQKPVSGYENMTGGTITMDLAKLPANMSMRANLSTGGWSTVRFDLDGKTGFRVESAAPYSLSGDMSGKLKAIKFSVGTHTVVANTVTGSSVTSSLGVTLKVVNGVTTSSPTTSTPTTGTNTGTTTNTGTSTGTTDTNTGTTDTNTDTTTGTTAGTPIATIKAISSVIPAGTSVHVDALSSQMKGGTWNEGTYVWNFGDTGSDENAMRGFNAAHTYDTAGTYTVSLTVTNAAGKTSTTTMKVTVTAAARKVIYVATNGSDSNDGLSADSPIKSVAKALTLVTDNTEIRFRRGQTFGVTSSFIVKNNNVVIGAYGTGVNPNIKWTGSAFDGEIFYISAGTKNFTAQDLTVSTVFITNTNDSGVPTAFRPGGTNFTARRIVLQDVKNGFLLNLNPSGVLIQSCSSPSETGLRKYFAWVQGDHVTIADNTVANSTREHIVRANFVSMLNVSDNEFHNTSHRESGEDYYDFRKPALNIQSGEFAYAYNNIIDSSFQVGPLGQADGDKVMMTPSLRFEYAVGEANTVLNEQIVINHGAEHITMRDNVVDYDNGLAITVDGYNEDYDRGVVDLTLDNNTVVNNGTKGSFISVYGAVAGIKMTDNLYIAPNLVIGEQMTAAVRLTEDAYNSFTEIDGNIWPVAGKISSWVGENAMNYIGTSYVKAGMLTAAEWNNLKLVGTDTFSNVSTGGETYLVLNGARVGAKLAA